MKKKVEILLALMAMLTVIYAGAVVYANVSDAPKSDGIYIVPGAFLYKGDPSEWYTPEQLGIVKVEDYGAGENATWLHVFIPRDVYYNDSKGEWVWGKIFKWERNGKFYKIEFWITPGLPEDIIKRSQIPIGGAIGAGWIISGIWIYKKREGK